MCCAYSLSQGFGRCARFTLGYFHVVCFADWLNDSLGYRYRAPMAL
jgi:hypothetical protein